LMRTFREGAGDRRDPHSFPTRRSSDLDHLQRLAAGGDEVEHQPPTLAAGEGVLARVGQADPAASGAQGRHGVLQARPMLLDVPEDRKSTRLNSSHVKISYAVFCLKKKR